MTTTTIDVLAKDINDRLESIGKKLEPAELRSLVSECLTDLMKDENSDFARKMRFGSDEQRALVGTKFARWGLSVQDVEFLYEMQESLKGQRKAGGGFHNGPSEELRNTFEAVSDALYLPADKVREIDQKALDGLFPRIPASAFRGGDVALAKKGKWELTKAYQSAVRAMDTAESGYGAQLVGAQYVRELWEAARMASKVFALIETFEMTDPTVFLPFEADIPEMLFVGESTANNSSDYDTRKSGSNRQQVDAKKFVIHQMWSGEMEEDSIVPFVPFLRMQAQKSLEHYSDSVVLNGDTTNAGTGNINLDDADPADTKHYLAFDGIRHVGLVDNTGNSKSLAGPITFAALIGQRARMVSTTYIHNWGKPTDPDDLIYVTDTETADKVALLDEFITVDKFGNNATVLNGQVGRIGRNPLIDSMAMSKTEADGKVSTTAANNTLGQAVAFNRRGFKVGWRRRVKTEVERLPGRDQTRLILSLRMGFGRFTPTGAASGIEAADVLYNITL